MLNIGSYIQMWPRSHFVMIKSSGFLLALLLISAKSKAQSGDDVKSLLFDIFQTRGYNKDVRPLLNQTNVLNVSVGFYLNSVIDFDEKTESLKTSGYLFLTWTDEYFTWTPASFNNVSSLFIPQDDIWKPDISLKNSFKSFNGLGSSYLKTFVRPNGEVDWLPFQVLESTCPVSITYFPFDVQTCDLKFSAWSYSEIEIKLYRHDMGIQLDEYVPNASWEIAETSGQDVTTEEVAVSFTIKLRRKPRFYIINIILPVIFLSILNIFAFVLPVTSGERSGYSITVFLSLVVFLTIVSDKLPNNSENTSLLAVYIMLVTSLSTAIVAVCMIQLRLYSWNETEKPISRFFMNFVSIHNFFTCGQCSKKRVEPMESMSSKQSLQDVPSEQRATSWLDVVNAMDFIFFTSSLLYTFICTLVTGVVLVVE